MTITLNIGQEVLCTAGYVVALEGIYGLDDLVGCRRVVDPVELVTCAFLARHIVQAELENQT